VGLWDAHAACHSSDPSGTEAALTRRSETGKAAKWVGASA
jgi:hypothetical protein